MSQAGTGRLAVGSPKRRREIPREVLDFAPQAPSELNFKLFSNCLRGQGGCTNEMLKVCLDDHENLQLLFCAADEFARGDVPRGVGHCFTLATLTALQKNDGGVRGIAGHLVSLVGCQNSCEAVRQAG